MASTCCWHPGICRFWHTLVGHLGAPGSHHLSSSTSILVTSPLRSGLPASKLLPSRWPRRASRSVNNFCYFQCCKSSVHFPAFPHLCISSNKILTHSKVPSSAAFIKLFSHCLLASICFAAASFGFLRTICFALQPHSRHESRCICLRDDASGLG